MFFPKKLLNKKVLGGLVTLGGIVSVGAVGFLNKTNEEQKVESTAPAEESKEIKNTALEPEVEIKAPEQEIPTNKDVKPEEPKTKVIPEEKAQKVAEPQSEEEKEKLNPKGNEGIVKGGRIYSEADLEAMKSRNEKDEAFAEKTGELSWSEGGNKLSEEKQKEIKDKFANSGFLKKLGDKRKLIDYTNHGDWRLKTSLYMRSDEYNLKELHSKIDDVDTDTDDWKEQYAWKLREACYKTAEEADNVEKVKEAFGIVESTNTELSIVNLCTFADTE